jgi:hypothetical protein
MNHVYGSKITRKMELTRDLREHERMMMMICPTYVGCEGMSNIKLTKNSWFIAMFRRTATGQ